MNVFLSSLLITLFLSGSAQAKPKDHTYTVSSPDGTMRAVVQLMNGTPYYSLYRNHVLVVAPSRLGFVLKDLPALDDSFQVTSAKENVVDETWEQPWGEVRYVRNQYRSLSLHLQESIAPKRKLILDFRLFNDGLGFRYWIPEQPGLNNFVIMDELTEFSLVHDFSTWWIPAYGDEMDSEYLYQHTKLDSLSTKVSTPFTGAFDDTLFISIHEAALVDYAGMALSREDGRRLKCDLVPWSNGHRVEATAPMATPWRTILVTSTPGQLVESTLLLNLNEPNKLDEVSWIKPGKYIGIWWGMHLQRQTWEGGPRHGATTQNVRDMIDFAAKHNLQGVLAEGWNQGWEGDWTVDGNFSFTKSYPDYDLKSLGEYAKTRNVNLIAHHETGGNVNNYENQLEDAFQLLHRHGIHYVKTGYVNKLPSGERHQGQFMVRHYHKVMETAAKYKVVVDMHEPVKDTGLRRTYPNLMTREGVRGTEYEAWSDGNPPSHTTILPFTRGLAGPIDYTPGIFNILFSEQSKFRVHTTLAKQLALYVVIYSPLQMAADLPENYEGQPAFQFIEDVPTDWEESHVINGSIGEFITTVRKDRNSSDWYLGSITDEQGRSIEVKLDFLVPGQRYVAIIYQDGRDADMETNPLPLEITKTEVTSQSMLTLKLAPGGGTAIQFKEIQ